MTQAVGSYQSKRAKLREHPWFWWALLGGYVLLIYSTLSIIRGVQNYLTGKFGDSIYWLVYGAIGLGFCLAFRSVLANYQRLRRNSLVWFGFLTIVYVVLMLRLNVLAERVHFLEYGLLSLGGFRLALFYTRSPLIYLWVTGLVYLVGMGDEFIQYLLPNRVGEYRDIIINGEAGALVQLILALALKPQAVTRSISRSQLARLLWFMALLIALTACFMVSVHTYGFQIVTEQGITFYSHFSEAELTTLTRLSSADLEHLAKQQPARHALYLREAGDHFNMMKFFCEQQQNHNARGEHLIAQTYFRSGLQALKLSPPIPCLRRVTSALAPPTDQPYQSRYLNDLITAVTRGQLLLYAGVIFVLFVAGAVIAARSGLLRYTS